MEETKEEETGRGEICERNRRLKTKEEQRWKMVTKEKGGGGKGENKERKGMRN